MNNHRILRRDLPGVSKPKDRMDLPPVSIIIDNFNYGRFLTTAINSALGQTLSPIEVIVVDDGSTDQSREIIGSYGDRIRAIYKENGGQASALNAGFAASRGEIIIFLDSDDVLHANTAERVYKIYQDDTQIAKINYRMEVIDENGRHIGMIKPPARLGIPSGDFSRRVLMFPGDIPWLPTSGNAFSRRGLKEIFPIPEEDFRILADYYLNQVAPLFGAVASIEQVGAYYRVHGSNAYENSGGTIQLSQIRKTIVHTQHVNKYLFAYAKKLGRSGTLRNPEEILSVSYVANQLVSVKLDREEHPMQKERFLQLLWEGFKATLRRCDASLITKCVYMIWFLSMFFAPKPAAQFLAEIFYFPEKRHRLLNIGKVGIRREYG